MVNELIIFRQKLLINDGAETYMNNGGGTDVDDAGTNDINKICETICEISQANETAKPEKKDDSSPSNDKGKMRAEDDVNNDSSVLKIKIKN
ncbi:917_t:CDS:2 [Dentiscutata erythropus]|uniref:917_t:CDS:1 n=1 Tax=Dentiscutata erythropus TaxID=1348616 RepID=A0A9N9FHV2_9GLOM|nr:917_t:CDS:2 [Dentiscutata erythropus]